MKAYPQVISKAMIVSVACTSDSDIVLGDLKGKQGSSTCELPSEYRPKVGRRVIHKEDEKKE